MGYAVQQSNATLPLRFLLVLSSDHITGATGKTPTVVIEKNDGLGFVTPAGAVTEQGFGWYQVAANTTDAGTLGPLTLHATAAACDPTDEDFFVVNYSPTAIAAQTTPATGSISVGDLITAALRRINVLQAGETPSAEDMADSFLRFNDWIDALSLDRLAIYTITRSTWALVSGTASYTVGSGGTVNIARPIYVDHVNYQDTSQSPVLERPLTLLTEDAYAAIPQKTLTNTLPQTAYYNPTYPLATLTFWMVPTSATLQGVIYAPTAVAEFGATTDTIALPPGYRRMLRDNLALELWPEFREHIPIDPGLLQSAQETKAAVKRANIRLADLSVDAALTVRHGLQYSIYSDGA